MGMISFKRARERAAAKAAEDTQADQSPLTARTKRTQKPRVRPKSRP